LKLRFTVSDDRVAVNIRVLMGKPEGKRPLSRPRCRWENNIKNVSLRNAMGVVDWINLAQDRDR
jgi:hypothetical protein